jgi:hypothetical protein
MAAQLAEAQEKLRAAEVQMSRLEDENSRLRMALAGQGEEGQRRLRDISSSPNRGGGADGNNAEGGASEFVALVRELKVQLVEETRRCADLERALNERTAVQRRQYEAHIDALELELRRAKAGGRNLGGYSGSGSGPGPASPSTVLAPTAFSSPSGGRTVESRKNLL